MGWRLLVSVCSPCSWVWRGKQRYLHQGPVHYSHVDRRETSDAYPAVWLTQGYAVGLAADRVRGSDRMLLGGHGYYEVVRAILMPVKWYDAEDCLHAG